MTSQFEELFDFRFERMIIKWLDLKSDWGSRLRDIPSTSVSSLNVVRPGVSVLLGKNGAGKSRFLAALEGFANFKSVNPVAVLRFALPSDDEHLEYLNTVESTKMTEEHSIAVQDAVDAWGGDWIAQLDYEKQVFNLRFHEMLVNSIVVPAYEGLRNSERAFGTSSTSDLLGFFGFTDAEVAAFRGRKDEYLLSQSGEGEWVEFAVGLRRNLNFRDYFPEFFLCLLDQSIVHVGGDQGPGSWFDASAYISDSNARGELVADLRWCLMNANYLDVRYTKNEYEFSLVVDAEPSGGLPPLTLGERQHGAMSYDNQTFPYDLFRLDQSCSTAFRRLRWDRWTPFDIVDLTFKSREKSHEDLERLFAKFVKVTTESADDCDYVLRIDGMDDLRAILDSSSKLLRESDIGVEALRIRPKTERVGFESGLSPRTHDFVPTIEWSGPGEAEWRTLRACSDGQLDVVRITVHLVEFTSRKRGCHANMLLIDEFNRHLHPTVSQVLLEQLDRFGRKSNTHVIASTHSFGSLEIQKFPQIFAERDEQGLHRLSTDRTTDSRVVAERLGVPERDAVRLKKLFLLVEGEHDELVFRAMIDSNPSISHDVEIVHADGLFGITGLWRSWLRHETADVILVYDKRNPDLEAEWETLCSGVRNSKLKIDPWNRYPAIEKTHAACKSRINSAYKDRSRQLPGDTELNKICYFLKEVVKSGFRSLPLDQFAQSLSRIHLHGLEAPDVVDLLPISSFPRATGYQSWGQLRGNPEHEELLGTSFKNKFGINSESIGKAIEEGISNQIHPELQRLFARVMGILEVRGSVSDPRLGGR